MKWFTALLFCLLLPVGAGAVERAVSASTWTVAGDEIALHYTFPTALSATLVAPGSPAPSTAAIAHYVFSKVAVVRNSAACKALDQGYDLGSVDARYVGPGLLSFEIFFHCAGGPGLLQLRNDAFFDRSGGQISLAKVWTDAQSPALRLITAGNTSIGVATGTTVASPLRSYAGLGFRHAFSGIVRLCTACGLLLLLRNRKELRAVMCALLAGYLIAAWAGGAGGWFLQAQSAQAFGGFLLVLVGALLVARSSGRPGSTAAGLAATIGIAAAIAALAGRGTALCLLGAGGFGALMVLSSRAELVASWLVPALGVLVGAVQGFSLSSLFEPLHAVITLGTAPLVAYSGGAFLGTLAIFAVVAVTLLLLLRRFAGFTRAPIYRDLATAALAAIGVSCMLAV